MDIQEALRTVVARQDLTQEQAREVMDQIMSGKGTDAQIGAYLIALRMKGETVEEIAGSAQAMREKSLRVSAPGTVVDTCGTGGDASGTFNISTTAALVVAACGITVAKHGNRSISSKSGSADVLRALGVNIDAPVAVVERCLAKAGIGFLFAPRHHEAMRFAMTARREIAVRTLFNLLGPLTNPASAPQQLLGVFDAHWTEPMARVLGRLGSRRALVVHGSDGLDEITTTGPTQAAELREDGSVIRRTILPEQVGIPFAKPEDLLGGDAETNAAITREILNGEKGPRRNIVLINAGAALYVSGAAANIRTGIDLAANAIDSGRARQRLGMLIELTNAE